MFFHAYNQFVHEEDLEGPELLKAYCNVISSFFDIDIEEVKKMPMSMYDGFEKNMTGLFIYIYGIMNTYVPKLRTGKGEDHVFTHKGEKWLIPWAINAKSADLTFGQGIELLEIERKATIEKENRKDAIDSIQYTQDLSKLAIMAKRPGEELPSGEMAVSRLVEERIQLFADIDMPTMMDALFFSNHGWNKLIQKSPSNGYSTHPHKVRQIKRQLRRTIRGAMRDN